MMWLIAGASKLAQKASRGEAVAEIVATGSRTKFGRRAELIRTAHVESTEQKAIFRVMRNQSGGSRGTERASNGPSEVPFTKRLLNDHRVRPKRLNP